jgi:hypothetical protein
MGVATRPKTTTVYELDDIANGVQSQHHIYEDITNYATYAGGLLEILVEVTDGEANYDLQVYDVTDSEEVYGRTGLKFARFLMNKKYDLDEDHRYDIRITNQDTSAADYKVTYTVVEYTLAQTG